VEIVNNSAPEHLELLVQNPAAFMKSIKNAGAIFAGYSTPTALGDYWAGPSHVLPTMGNARFSSGLSVATFLKRTSYVEYSKQAAKSAAANVTVLASAEGMRAHQESINVRTREIK
jgi:histidinol dehydrogenase